jgi:hypothetical protein
MMPTLPAAHPRRAPVGGRSVTTQWSIAVCCFGIALILGLLIPWAETHGDLGDVAAGIGVIVIVGGLAIVPVRMLPGIALLVSLLIPAEASFLPKLLEGAALGAVPLAVWMIRARGRVRAPGYLRCLAMLFGAWVVVSECFAPFHTNRGLEWCVVVEVTLVLAVVWTPAGIDIRKLRSLFLAITTVLGIYALLEGFVLHSDPLFGRLFDHTLWWARRRFDTSYRITTLLGQPLDNGLVFSAAAVLAASELMGRRDKVVVALVRLAILSGAVVATHERGSAVGLAVGVLAVIMFTRRQRYSNGRTLTLRRVVLLAGATIGVVIFISALRGRDESSQGRASASIRTAVIARTTDALHGMEPFGAGPGEVDSDLVAKHLTTVTSPTVAPDNSPNVTLEDSYAEIVVDLGPIGALLGVLLLAAIVFAGLRTPLLVGETAALVTLLIDIGGYNAIEGQRSVLVLISLLSVAIITGADAVRGRLTSRRYEPS